MFCGMCGKPTTPFHGGTRVRCVPCRNDIYPRTDTVVIVLVENAARTHCLLGRGRNYPKGMYTCVSGFAEVCESLEEAAAREVLEETGVILGVRDVSYHSSQPWPVGNAAYAELMVACRAVAAEGAVINIGTGEELEAARWFSREELAPVIDMPLEKWSVLDGTLRLPAPYAVAHHLIKTFIAGAVTSKV